MVYTCFDTSSGMVLRKVTEKPGDVAQLVELLPSIHKTLCSFSFKHCIKPGVVFLTAFGRWRLEDQKFKVTILWLYSEFEVNLDYVRSCLKFLN